MERVVIVHSPAFGGRGMFVTTGYKIEEEKLSPVFRGRGTFETDGPDEPSRNPPKPPKPPNPPKPPPLLPKSQFPSRNCMVIVLMAALVFVGTHVGGVGRPVFDMTCGYPGEGPVEVTDDLVMFFQHKFPEASLVPISEEIIRLGNHPLRYKIACRPTLYNYFGGWLGQGQRIYWRLQRLVNKLRKEKEKQRIKKLSHDLKQAKRDDVENKKKIAAVRTVLGELKPLKNGYVEAQNNFAKVKKERDRLAER